MVIEGNRKGGNVYVSNGFLYLKNNIYKGKMNLRCQVHSSGCTGTAYIGHGKFVEGKPHMHPQQFEKVEKFRIESRIKTESEKSPWHPVIFIIKTWIPITLQSHLLIKLLLQ